MFEEAYKETVSYIELLEQRVSSGDVKLLVILCTLLLLLSAGGFPPKDRNMVVGRGCSINCRQSIGNYA